MEKVKFKFNFDEINMVCTLCTAIQVCTEYIYYLLNFFNAGMSEKNSNKIWKKEMRKWSEYYSGWASNYV